MQCFIPRVHEVLKEFFNGIQLKHTVNPDCCGNSSCYQSLHKGSTAPQNSCQDVTPSSRGIEEAGGDFIVQIPKGSKIPFTKQQYWWPDRDNQHSAKFQTYEGEDKIARNNRLLGKFVLHLPPSVKKDEGQMESITTVDDEGILTVRAASVRGRWWQ